MHEDFRNAWKLFCDKHPEGFPMGIKALALSAFDAGWKAAEAFRDRVDRGEVKKLLSEINRLKSGDFTEEEFQNLCHKFQEDDACRFAEGCVRYNEKLFGDKSRLEVTPHA